MKHWMQKQSSHCLKKAKCLLELRIQNIQAKKLKLLKKQKRVLEEKDAEKQAAGEKRF